VYGQWSQVELVRRNWESAWQLLDRALTLPARRPAEDLVATVVLAARAELVRRGQRELAERLIAEAAGRYPESRVRLRDLPQGGL
jgi:hypothetical protein